MKTADRKWFWIGSVLLVAALLVLPFLVKNYRVFQFNHNPSFPHPPRFGKPVRRKIKFMPPQFPARVESPDYVKRLEL